MPLADASKRLTWSVRSAVAGGVEVARVLWAPGPPGRQPVLQIKGNDAAIEELIAYYLLDPLGRRPVFIEGLGYRKGPHTQSADQMSRAMVALGLHFAGLEATPVDTL